VHGQDLLDFRRIHIKTARLNHVLFAIRDMDPAGGVFEAQIAGVKPAVDKAVPRLCSLL